MRPLTFLIAMLVSAFLGTIVIGALEKPIEQLRECVFPMDPITAWKHNK